MIGSNGKARKNIERLTNSDIAIYGKTVSIIGNYDNVEKAFVGINKIIDGAPHKNTYRLLEKKYSKSIIIYFIECFVF